MLSTMRTRRRAALSAGVLLGATALTVGLAVPASAVTIADWVTGHIPSGCSATSGSLAGTNLNLTYSDTVVPTVTGWAVNGKTTYATLVPGSQTIAFTARVKQGCGGLADSGGGVYLRIANGAATTVAPLSMEATTTNPYDQTFKASFPGDTSYAGSYQVVTALFAKRYDTVTVNTTDYSYVSSTPNTASTGLLTGPWALQKTFLLLKTTVTTSASKTTVAAGTSVTFRATLKKAGAVTYDPAVGSLVKFQTKTATGSWVTRATKTATSAGTVAYTFKPSKTMSWRWVHAGETTSKYTAPVTSTVRKITVS